LPFRTIHPRLKRGYQLLRFLAPSDEGAVERSETGGEKNESLALRLRKLRHLPHQREARGYDSDITGSPVVGHDMRKKNDSVHLEMRPVTGP